MVSLKAIGALIRGSLLASLAVLGGIEPAYSAALEGPVYLETYKGEENFPTSPEIDRLGLGPTYGFTLGSDPGRMIPVLDGDAALAEVTSIGPSDSYEWDGTLVFIGSKLSAPGSPFTLLGRFNDFIVTPGPDGVTSANAWVGVVCGTECGPLPYFLYAGIFQTPQDDPSNVLLIVEGVGGPVGVRRVPVPVAVAEFPFDIALVFDPAGSGSALARLKINGAIYETEALPLIAYRPPIFLMQSLQINNYFGADDVASVKFRGLCISGLNDRGHVCEAALNRH